MAAGNYNIVASPPGPKDTVKVSLNFEGTYNIGERLAMAQKLKDKLNSPQADERLGTFGGGDLDFFIDVILSTFRSRQEGMDFVNKLFAYRPATPEPVLPNLPKPTSSTSSPNTNTSNIKWH